MDNKIHLTCWGGVGAVTGANFLLESSKTRLLVDCGLLQGVEGADTENSAKFPYDPKTIDYLFVTHAHMDHIGKIPKLVRDGFRGVIYSTAETRDLARLMFDDAMKVMENNRRDANAQGIHTEPQLYQPVDVQQANALWQTIEYHVPTQIGADFSVYLKDAGHILGSAMYEFTYGGADGKKILFTGDSGNSPSPLLKDTESIEGANYLVMDSVYGDRNHEPKDERDARFKQIVTETIAAGGALVIPAFSIERTQVILFELNKLVEQKEIPSVPVFLDSPLGSHVTGIYERAMKDFNVSVQNEIHGGDDIFDFPKLTVTQNSFESREIEQVKNPKIIIAGSGMSAGGRVVGHEVQFLPDPKSTILLMGYQAVGTLGRDIQNFAPDSPGARKKGGTIDIDGQQVVVNARVEMISGYSSHKDSDHLVEMAAQAQATLKKVFVVMGEPKSSLYLVQRLRDYAELDAIYPERGKVYELEV